MKGKKILSLVSLFAGAAIIGTTFAAWAVTDNADPFGMKISPGSIAEDKTNYVTLSYGDRAYADKIEGLEYGKDRLGATVGLKADTSNSASYTGKFRITLINQTEKQQGENLLIEHLFVDVYDQVIAADSQGIVTTDRSGMTPIGHIPTQASEYVKDIAVTVTDNTQKIVYVVIGLEEVNASVLNDIKNDVVYLQMDWNSNGTDEVQTSTIYFRGTAGNDAYVYAWTDSKVNAQYPGVKMTELQEGYFSYELSADFSNLLFVQKNQQGAEFNKTEDLTVNATIRQQTPCYDKTLQTPAWVAAPEFETLTKDYYLVGTFNGWAAKEAFGLTVDPQNANHYTIKGVMVEAGALLKVRSQDGAHWYGNAQGENFVINDAGTYDFDFYANAEQGTSPIVCQPSQA